MCKLSNRIMMQVQENDVFQVQQCWSSANSDCTRSDTHMHDNCSFQFDWFELWVAQLRSNNVRAKLSCCCLQVVCNIGQRKSSKSLQSSLAHSFFLTSMWPSYCISSCSWVYFWCKWKVTLKNMECATPAETCIMGQTKTLKSGVRKQHDENQRRNWQLQLLSVPNPIKTATFECHLADLGAAA